MNISESMNKRLNDQITNELNAAHSYLAMAYAFDTMGLKIFSQRFHEQSTEERDHALRIAKYLVDVGGTVALQGLAKPRNDYPTAAAIVEAALENEKAVTRQINELVALAGSEKDYASHSFLQWFVNEQVEEVATMTELLQWVQMAGEANLFVVESRIASAMQKGEG